MGWTHRFICVRCAPSPDNTILPERFCMRSLPERKEDGMTQTSTLMKGKRGLIMGVANERSIAWGIAETAHKHGAELAFTFQGDALEKRVRPLAESVQSKIVVPCDVMDMNSIDATFKAVEKEWGS